MEPVEERHGPSSQSYRDQGMQLSVHRPELRSKSVLVTAQKCNYAIRSAVHLRCHCCLANIHNLEWRKSTVSLIRLLTRMVVCSCNTFHLTQTHTFSPSTRFSSHHPSISFHKRCHFKRKLLAKQQIAQSDTLKPARNYADEPSDNKENSSARSQIANKRYGGPS